MAFNGSGVFVRLYNWVNDAAANIKIRADRMDNEMNGMATGLSTCITKDGQTTVTANLPMATFKHTGVGNASLRTQYFAAGQAVDGVINWAVAGGTADAITASYTIPLSTLIDGQLCYVRAGAANATTTPTFSPDGITARTITQLGGNALAAGSIAGAGHELELRYKLASTRWELLNPAISSNATNIAANWTPASASGPASLAFAEDTDNGSNKVTLTAPASIAADVAITLPGVASTLATLAGTETLTNKTISTASNTITQSTTSAQGVVELATTAETQTGTDTDRAITAAGLLGALGFTKLFTSTGQTITAGGSLTLAHSIGRAPILIIPYLVCGTNDSGYTVGQKLYICLGRTDSARGVVVVPDATNLNVRYGSAANTFSSLNFSNGNDANLTNSSWTLFLEAWG